MLRGKIALVTGATRHTGRAIAAELLTQGATVYVNGRDEAALAATVAALGPNARAALADLSDERQIRQMMASVLSEAGRLDILVNNACNLGISPSFVESSLDLLDQVMAVNFRAVYLLSQLAAADMMERGEGSIINISSNTSERIIRDRPAYIASKGAVNALGRVMAVELAPHGIRVNTILPGYIHTSRWDEITDQARDRRRANVPLGKEASGEDIARAVAFLASDRSAGVVGAQLTIDGGVSAQLLPIDADG